MFNLLMRPYFRQIFWEEEDEGGSGAYAPDFKYWIYISLSAHLGRDTDEGAHLIDAFRILDRETTSIIKIKYPNPGFEKDFREDIEGKTGELIAHDGSRMTSFALISDGSLEALDDNGKKLIIDIGGDLLLPTGVNRKELVRLLERVGEVLDHNENLSDSLLSKRRAEHWFDAVELKPGMFGLKIDLKKMYRAATRS